MAHYTTKVSRKYLAYTVERLQLNGKKLSAVTVGVRNNSQPATVVEMAYTRDLKSLGEILARSNRVGSTTTDKTK